MELQTATAPTAPPAIIMVQTPANTAWRLTKRCRNNKHRAMTTRAFLMKRFPLVFMPFDQPKIPLKIGIRMDIIMVEPTMDWNNLHLALKDYTNGRSYLRNMEPGAYRIGLDGLPAGVVTEEQAAFAAAKLAKLEIQQ